MAKARKTARQTPSALGFSMPAEWEPHEATWLAWPHNPTDWPDKLDTIRWVYGEIVRRISPGEIIRMLVNSRAARAGSPSLSDARRRRCRTRGIHRPPDQPRVDARQRSDLRPEARRHEGGNRDRSFPFQRLGEISRLEQGPEGAGDRRQGGCARGCSTLGSARAISCSRAAASTSTAAARC